LLGERRRWLKGEPTRYAGMLPEGEAAWREFLGLVSTCGPADLAAYKRVDKVREELRAQLS
jgi:hypothetical protein